MKWDLIELTKEEKKSFIVLGLQIAALILLSGILVFLAWIGAW